VVKDLLTSEMAEKYRKRYPVDDLIKASVEGQEKGQAKYPPGTFLRLNLFQEIEEEARDIVNYVYLMMLRLKMLEDLVAGTLQLPAAGREEEDQLADPPAMFQVPAIVLVGPRPYSSIVPQGMVKLTILCSREAAEIFEQGMEYQLLVIPTGEKGEAT